MLTFHYIFGSHSTNCPPPLQLWAGSAPVPKSPPRYGFCFVNGKVQYCSKMMVRYKSFSFSKSTFFGDSANSTIFKKAICQNFSLISQISNAFRMCIILLVTEIFPCKAFHFIRLQIHPQNAVLGCLLTIS